MRPTSPGRPDGAEKRFKFVQLSTEENYAWRYALAVLDPEHHRKTWEQWNTQAEEEAFVRGLHISSAKEKSFAISVGLARLAEKGLVELARNGEGTLEPTHLHAELVDFDGTGGSLVLADGN